MSQEDEFLEVAEQKLSVAELLHRNEEYNDAISRAYYSMFNSVRAMLLKKDSKPKTHQGVASEFGKLYRNEVGPEITREFSKIQNKRLEADYEPNADLSKNESEHAIETATKLLKHAQESSK